jgi:hypothetical protein
MIKLENPRREPSRMDKLALGHDCVTHGYFGIAISNNGTPGTTGAQLFAESETGNNSQSRRQSW